MDNREIIQASIDYIEDNLKTEITVNELAEMAGFSLFHYYRLFQTAVGMPVVQYIVHRKLVNAIYEIDDGRKMIDVALAYGFDTYAGFYKAFQREFGCTPSAFLKRHKAPKPYRINLFKEEYIMLAHKKVSEILKHWGLEQETIFDIYYEGSGYKNENAFYVGDKYVIKFTPNLGKVRNNIELSKALENVGLSAASLIKTKDDEEYIRDGELYFYLTKRLEGKQIVPRDMYDGDFRKKARFVGEIIGQLHLALQNVEAVVSQGKMFEDVKNWALPKTKEILGLSEAVCEDYLNTFGKAYEELTMQVIHRDPNPGNIICGDDTWGFIDFELSEKNIRIFDPCYAATAILSESFTEDDGRKLEKWVEIYKNMIYGYDSVVKLSDAEREAIPYVILSNQLICVAWFAEQEKYPDVYEINKKMTGWIVEHFQELKID